MWTDNETDIDFLNFSMDYTAFVIAADESMIKHAVKRHFQGVDDALVTNYFDKLIQVPIRVPQLGVQEVRAYMMLLYIEASSLDGMEKDELRKKICERLGRTWRGERVDAEFVKGLLGHWPDGLELRLDTADRLAVLMTSAKEIAGNPRLIKRFLNALSLRMSLAKEQGVSVDEAVLTKLLLFERCGSPDAYEALMRSATEDPQGKPTVVATMEAAVRKSENAQFEKPWDGTFMRDWFALDPALGDHDLRGALYVSREHAPLVLPENRLSKAATDLLEGLIEHPEMADSVKTRIAETDPRSLATILEKLLELARKEQEWGTPKILTACLAVTRGNAPLGNKLSAFLKDRPGSQIKPSIVPRIADEPWSNEVFPVWLADDEVSGTVKAAIKHRTEKKKSMGTSSSSKGSPSNVPMVPPWVPDLPSGPAPDGPPDLPPEARPLPPPNIDIEGGEDGNVPASPSTPIGERARLAPPGRFGAARTNLTSFARNSDRTAMRRGIGQYVSQGYGGSGTATRRMGGTIRSSETLIALDILDRGASSDYLT
jgi:predicted KAP-like P-loop ATPase